MAVATKIEFLSREDACAHLGLKERRLRDYVTAGRIRQSEDGLLHAGDVARLQEERDGRKANSQLRALSTVTSGLTPEQRAQLARAGVQSGMPQGGNPAIGNMATRALPSPQSGNAATDPLPDCAWLTLAQAERYTGLPASVLLHRIESGKLPALDVGVRPGGRWRVKRVDLDDIRGERVKP